ncbi:MAG TPA: hypothetical protein VKE51_09330 [Vicinamibacterales bacterium]|nr:hypothetical protein [Vicinamibacterales bacterium]
MRNRLGFTALLAVLLLLAAVGAGVYGYNIGVAHGIAQSAALAERGAAAPGAAAPVVFYPRPWGFGFGFFPFAPLFFILFWILIFRALFWRGPRWGRGYGYACAPGGVPPAFDEWHRRAHAQPAPEQTAPPPHSV